MITPAKISDEDLQEALEKLFETPMPKKKRKFKDFNAQRVYTRSQRRMYLENVGR